MSVFCVYFCSLFGWLQSILFDRLRRLLYSMAGRGRGQLTTTTTTAWNNNKTPTNKVTQIAVGDGKNNCARSPFILEIGGPTKCTMRNCGCVFSVQTIVAPVSDRTIRFRRWREGFVTNCYSKWIIKLSFVMSNGLWRWDDLEACDGLHVMLCMGAMWKFCLFMQGDIWEFK